jgi:hypothetical protein
VSAFVQQKRHGAELRAPVRQMPRAAVLVVEELPQGEAAALGWPPWG